MFNTFGKLHNHGYIEFDDIIPVDARIIENLEYILYPCLALNILAPGSGDTDSYEFTCYDSLRDEYYTAELSKDWRIALEQLVERPDMSEILAQLLREEENKIKLNPALLKSRYRTYITSFINFVDGLKEGERNFILKTKVVGQRVTPNNQAKEGVIPRYIKRLENEIQIAQKSSNNILTSVDLNKQVSLPDSGNKD